MTLVFTNGVFDILHSGHLRLLNFAADQGDNLLIGINSDDSVKRLKGPTRPIFSEVDRKELLLSLKIVDSVYIFHEDTPENLIKELKPDVLVKGPEAANAPIPGADYVRSYGGKVLIPDLVVAESTTQIIKAVLENYEYPIPKCCIVEIEREKIVNLSVLSILFNKQPDGVRPVLYENGKRVTDRYSIIINHCQPKDQNGASA